MVGPGGLERGSVAKHGVSAPDNFSEWHRCRRWTERGLTCPFGRLEDREESKSEEDADARPSGAEALSRAVGDEVGISGFAGAMEFIGPLLALFTIMRAVQTLGNMQMGRVTAAGFAEEATVRTLRPEIPAEEGPRPSRPTRPSKVPVGQGRAPPPRGGGGGGFFFNQAEIMRGILRR